MEANQAQLQKAAKAGVQILQDETIRVPVVLASSGDINLLHIILSSVASGKLVVVEPAVHEAGLKAIKQLEELSRDKGPDNGAAPGA